MLGNMPSINVWKYPFGFHEVFLGKKKGSFMGNQGLMKIRVYLGVVIIQGSFRGNY